jgi:hypothetical protein
VADLTRAGDERPADPVTALDLYWIPLGAGAGVGARVVRTSGRIYDALLALVQRRRRAALYHAALIATTPAGTVTVEMTPVPDADGAHERGAVAQGAVGSALLGRFRLFRYEVRRWPGGNIPDLAFAVDSPVRLTDEPAAVERALAALPGVPTYVWGRDQLRAGEMWNSNSVVSWTLSRAGLVDRAGAPPAGGRAPGWDAGLLAAHR